MPGDFVVGKIELAYPPPDNCSAGVYGELHRLKVENDALRSLLGEWYALFAPVRKPETEGAILLDRTAEAIKSEFSYKTWDVSRDGTASAGTKG